MTLKTKPQLELSEFKEKHICQITNVLQETPRSISIQMKLPEQGDFAYKPGQFVQFSMKINDVYYSRCYSISSLTRESGVIRITVQKLKTGLVSNWLYENASIGMQCQISDPIGQFYIDEKHLEKPLALFGAGSGVTPLLPILKFLQKMNFKKSVHVFLSFSRPEDFILEREFNVLFSQIRNCHVYVNFTQSASTKPNEAKRLNYKNIQKSCSYISECRAFVCGSGGYVADITTCLEELKLDRKNILTEHFTLIAQTSSKMQHKSKVQLDKQVICEDAKGDKSILELAEEAGCFIDSICRNGLCGACMVMVEGSTQGGCTEALDQKSIADGFRLACCTYPLGDCSVFRDVSS